MKTPIRTRASLSFSMPSPGTVPTENLLFHKQDGFGEKTSVVRINILSHLQKYSISQL